MCDICTTTLQSFPLQSLLNIHTILQTKRVIYIYTLDFKV
mgnify:FL=1